jgi:hypothetical protein
MISVVLASLGYKLFDFSGEKISKQHRIENFLSRIVTLGGSEKFSVKFGNLFKST